MLESAAHAVCLERQTPTAAAIRWRSNPSARRLWGLHAPTDPSKPCNRSIRMPDPTTNDPLGQHGRTRNGMDKEVVRSAAKREPGLIRVADVQVGERLRPSIRTPWSG